MSHSSQRAISLGSRLLSAAFAVLLTLGCTTPGSIPVSYAEYLDGESFRGLESFTLLNPQSQMQRGTQPEEHELHELIQSKLRQEFERRGFSYDDTGEAADFLVTFHCRTREVLSTKIIDREWYLEDDLYYRPVTPRHVISTIHKATIAIDVVTPAPHRRLWRGIASGAISADASGPDLEQIVERSVRDIVAEFPPPPSD